MMGNLLVTGPEEFETKYLAYGSFRYPTSTALMRDMAASVSVPWTVASWAVAAAL